MKRRDRILAFIQTFTEEQGYAPTIREIADAVGLRSTSTVHGHIERLVQKGLLSKETMRPRTLTTNYNGDTDVEVLELLNGTPVRILWCGREYELKVDKTPISER